jgi:DMSO/TMAO reductase YedYZ molybdopterin-dependent catalytic subunit
VKMKNKGIYLIMLILVVVTVFFAFQNRQGRNNNAETVRIMKEGQIIQEITMEEVKALEPKVEREITLRSSQGTETHKFTGIPLETVINSVDPSLLKEARQVLTRGIDGYTVAFNIDELTSDDNILLVYYQDGKPLGNKSNGGTGPFRIIAVADHFAMRADKFITELEVR